MPKAAGHVYCIHGDDAPRAELPFHYVSLKLIERLANIYITLLFLICVSTIDLEILYIARARVIIARFGSLQAYFFSFVFIYL